MTPLHTLLILSMAIGAFSLTATKTYATKPLREWLVARSKVLGKLVSCHYCFSHWVTFATVIMCRVRVVEGPVLNFLISSFTLVAAANIIAGILMHLLMIHEDQVDGLKQELAEAREAIRSLMEE